MVESRSGSIVGSSDETVCNHAPSMKRIEPGPNRDNPETPDKIVSEEVRFCRSTTNGSRGLETPKTYVGVVLAAARGRWAARTAARASPTSKPV
jgi:hypothetical protein